MDFLKTWFPFSFRPADARAFVITVLIYLVLGAVGVQKRRSDHKGRLCGADQRSDD